MNAEHQSIRSIREFTSVLTGPAIWSAHFFALYATEALLCTFPTITNGQLLLIALTVTVMAVAALVLFLSRQALQSARHVDVPADSRFLRGVSIALAAIAMLAVIWGILPVILLPACTPAI